MTSDPDDFDAIIAEVQRRAGPLPDPTPAEIEDLKAAARRRQVDGPAEPDDFDAMMAQLARLAETGGAYPSDKDD